MTQTTSAPTPAPTNLLRGYGPSELALFLAAIALIFALRRWRKNVVKRQRGATNDSGGAARASTETQGKNGLSMRDVTHQVQALLVEMEETSRRASAQMDNRYRKLEQLLAEVDGKIAKLELLQRQLMGSPEQDAEGTFRRESPETVRTDAPRNTANEDATRPVYQLADAGMGAKEIAQRLGKQPGEIELILALRTDSHR